MTYEETCRGLEEQIGSIGLFVLLITTTQIVTYWGGIGYYGFMRSRESIMAKYQIKGGQKPSRQLINTALTDAVLDTCLLTPVIAAVAAYFIEFDVCRALPSLIEIVCHFALSFLFTDTTFYWCHRALHHPMLYASIHKQHHEFKATVSVATLYDHPVEDVINTLTAVGGPFLLNSHPIVLAVYAAMRVHQSIDAHSGLDLPFPYSIWNVGICKTSSVRHAYHHSENVGNYGDWFPFWDYLCGTDVAWKRSLEASATRD
eukprot:TRINITY_DN11042_c1_g3_i1.p1 TRINITY_DN11042_c1_g3~~TRINITY_DN11042_c1_g3_i1.p1  ORF type:complete len:279 (+),score=42.77 TRINITY_DN11042_c1_g3_i1:63-839(+)